MVDEEYVWNLVRWGKRSANNLAALEKRSSELFSQLETHMGGQLVSVAAPGQHIAYNRPMTLQDEFGAVNRAIEILTTGGPGVVQVTYPRIW